MVRGAAAAEGEANTDPPPAGVGEPLEEWGALRDHYAASSDAAAPGELEGRGVPLTYSPTSEHCWCGDVPEYCYEVTYDETSAGEGEARSAAAVVVVVAARGIASCSLDTRGTEAVAIWPHLRGSSFCTPCLRHNYDRCMALVGLVLAVVPSSPPVCLLTPPTCASWLVRNNPRPPCKRS